MDEAIFLIAFSYLLTPGGHDIYIPLEAFLSPQLLHTGVRLDVEPPSTHRVLPI